MARNEITISTQEYKALLAREVPGEKDKIMMESIIDTLKDHMNIVGFDEYRADFKGLEFKREADCMKEIMAIIYGVDRARFIEMYEELARDKKENDIRKMNADYMRKIKELKNDD